MPNRVWIGWDAREMVANNVAEYSLRIASFKYPEVRRLALLELQAKGLYTRPTIDRGDQATLWDELSDAPMSTSHAIARFFVPWLSSYQGWALFVDGDVLFRSDVSAIFAAADSRYAVQVVQHAQLPIEGTKKDGVPQLAYPRKNWSSVMLFNCAHVAHGALSLDVLNTWPGRDLHAFKWLPDELIGTLDPGWNYLVGAQEAPNRVHLAHYTLGTPNLPGHGADPFADEWFAVAQTAGYRLQAGV